MSELQCSCNSCHRITFVGTKCVFRSCYGQCSTIKHLYGRSELSSMELFNGVC